MGVGKQRMADFLLVHDAAHGAWSSGRLWGHLTAPADHPPRLFGRGRVGKVVSTDLPGHGLRTSQGRAALTFEDCVSAVVSEVQSHDLHDLVLSGHGLTAPILFHAASRLEEPPKRIVLFAGVIPDEGKTPLESLPRLSRAIFKLTAGPISARRREFRVPSSVVAHLYCNGMDPFDVIQIVGRFAPMPMQLLRTKTYLNEVTRNCPVTYVPLWRDRLLPWDTQNRMANRLGGVEMSGELDSCHEVAIERPRQVAEILLRYA